MTRRWLMKSEPDVFSIDDLKRDRKTRWTGVRNYQARNFMMNEMKVGDLVLFYHSNAEPPGVAGIAKISALAAPDLEALDKKSEFYDPKATPEKPIWYAVEIAFQKKFKELVPLDRLRKEPALSKMFLLRKGSRLSVQPVTEEEFTHIEKMAN